MRARAMRRIFRGRRVSNGPLGNRIEIVSYENVQFTKAPHVLRGMGLAKLGKNREALKELADKGIAPD